MSFFGVIIYIVVIVVIINAKKSVQSDSSNRNAGGRKPNLPQNGKKTVPNQSASKAIPNAPKNTSEAVPNVPKKNPSAVPNVLREKRKRNYMEPHREERRQPKIRTNNLWGEDEHAHKRIVALRLMEGDPVPEGYVKIICPYCAAENLVTKHCKRYHSCYFCRVPID